ncbi:ATP synthase CF1 epsilon subunit (chloroplast) [Cryptomeria japonica]|uniref:ATP synthase epsilon chain, chloroplastic n=2 Tax=Cryptomeria japonica TaxID=3369 RepID=B1VKF2_CRYJA|nr:ATP synthase CF1 epsilon subunit [Cryptomeria japonica]XP_057840523.2 ATP synthase epsilon chain, chloroplastic-like [Cryptomeria japonica]XP_059066904.1 ATP synthase epsilon chain, chloroplastic-like [Cryptomeria japonica]QLF67976.1 ATP synthase CF1 epsilon subunit [Cryptomeria japonica var. sinensis]UFA48239.1 ATP synthase CF1 epsilon subunit [Cryptomeria japonica var. sinensis]UFA48321.1 ATP synthase CF1 epsilon subunit [Cryptomeria japonica var. sinensis]UFA48403.1 ATP synthase CF1 eps
MNLNLRVVTPNRVVWDSEVQEIILATNNGQMGVLPNHTALVTALDIGVMKIRLNAQWSTMALMGGFATIDNNEITLLVNNAERGIDIDLQEAQESFRLAAADRARAEGKRQAIEADVALKRARTRLEAADALLFR